MTPDGPWDDPKMTPDGPRMDPGWTPAGPQMGPGWTPDGPQTGPGTRDAPYSTFSRICSPLRLFKELPREPPRDSPRTSERRVRLYVFLIFVNLGGRKVQIGKFQSYLLGVTVPKSL